MGEGNNSNNNNISGNIYDEIDNNSGIAPDRWVDQIKKDFSSIIQGNSNANNNNNNNNILHTDSTMLKVLERSGYAFGMNNPVDIITLLRAMAVQSVFYHHNKR